MIIRKILNQDKIHFPLGLELLNRTQGRDLFGPDYLELKTNDPEALVIGAFEGGALVGLGVAELINKFEYYQAFDKNIAEDLKNKTVGSFSTLCVRENLQGHGIGQKISQERLKWLKNHNCSVVLGISWVSGLSHTSDRVFSKMGFRPVKRVENFFFESSKTKPFVCPGCGEPPCTCAAILYRLDV